MKRLIVGITGASGALYGVKLLQLLRRAGGVETHVVLSQAGGLTTMQELGLSRGEVEALADVAHNPRDIGASIASGSFRVEGMVVAPCSMRTLAGIANGLGEGLVGRAADVALKERRRLVLMVRETPLHLAHLRNMTSATEMGAIVYPPVPAFYARPGSIDEMVEYTLVRVLDLFGIEVPFEVKRWEGLKGGPVSVGAAA